MSCSIRMTLEGIEDIIFHFHESSFLSSSVRLPQGIGVMLKRISQRGGGQQRELKELFTWVYMGLKRTNIQGLATTGRYCHP